METYDIVIIGGGGAGLTAGLYTSRARFTTLILEGSVPGGQIAPVDWVENYPGFPEGISGLEISNRMQEQAKRYGAIIQLEKVKSLAKKASLFEISTEENKYLARSLILASGANPKKLHVPGETEFMGKGVSYCATCDGAFFKGKKIVVVGGGDSAIQEALFLTRFAKTVKVIHRRNKLRASALLEERAFNDKRIVFIWDTVVTEIVGKNKVEKVKIKNVETNTLEELATDGVFIFVGHQPATEYLNNFVELDEQGYIKTDENLTTSQPGVFACGEVRAKAVRQLISVCGEGCQAALAGQKYLEEQSNV